MTIPPVTIAGRPVGPGCPPYVVAELSGNHNGDLDRALALIDVAKRAGADAVKLQTYTAETMTIDHHGPGFDVEGGLWDGQTLYALYQQAHTPWDWHRPLFDHARALGLGIFSTPFDSTAVDLLEGLDAPAYKIASFELVDLPLIALVARTGKPVILSTGMADDAEIAAALAVLRDQNAAGVVLLHCVSGYPTPADESNLPRLRHLAETFGTVVGLSDHSLGVEVSVAAVALGAALIEKHVTLARADGGPDCGFSLEPDELAVLTRGTRTAWAAVQTPPQRFGEAETRSLTFRRSLYVVADIAAGEPFTAANLRAIRPGFGLPPGEIDRVIGRRAARALTRGTPVDWSMVGD